MPEKKDLSTSAGLIDNRSRLLSHLHSGLTGWPTRILPGVLILAGVIFVRGMGWLQGLEWKALDAFLRVRPAETLDERIIIVGIDEADVQQMGTYPIPDQQLAELLRQIQTHNPRAIGLDIYRDLPVEPGHASLNAVFQSSDQLIAINKLLPPQVAGPPALPESQYEFADVVMDDDGFVRRSLLGAADPTGDYHFSFAIRLAESYLERDGFSLENGRRDPVAMRFGAVELPPLPPNAGSYVRADMGGHQVLVNYRSGQRPFRILSWRQIQSGEYEPDWFRDRLVLIGITAPSVKDFISTAAVTSDSTGQIFGIEYQAHAISQITSAVLDDRSLLFTWSEGWEYSWIVFWGSLGIVMGSVFRRPLPQMLSVVSGCSMLLVIAYGGLLWLGWWIPIVPTLAVFITNGVVFPLFYWYDRELRSRIQDRQRVIDNTFSAIHNGPLQTLASLLQDTYQPAESQPALYDRLQMLNQELRDVYGFVRQETVVESPLFHLSHHQTVDLELPLHQMLYEVYTATIEQDLPGFSAIKVNLIDFAPMDTQAATVEDRRDLCRFLQESLQNVGKHAQNTTRLTVDCKQVGRHNLIRVADNSSATLSAQLPGHRGGYGTQQAELLASRLRGRFKRYANTPRGTVCELTWPIFRRDWWLF